ncbi:MAG: homoserine kinase [Flammeovirgaceae bacterium]|nr:homoserine kinase [Flammeovirgaceae bacterium]
MEKSIKVFAPATIANVACGFDILGLALTNPGDEVIVKKKASKGITIINQTPYTQIPENPAKNTAGVALKAFLDKTEHDCGFEITISKKIKPGSGIGSSAASSAAAVFGANELMDNPFTKKELIQFAMEGEKAACGSPHADNVAPAMIGGFVLVRSYQPLDIIPLTYPEDLYCTIIHPQIELKTEDARRILKRSIQLQDAVKQWGNIAGLVAGLFQKDYDLIGRSLEDVIIEPIRSQLIPGYEEVKAAALDNGALGCSISGSGPSMFSFSKDKETAEKLAKIKQGIFSSLEIDTISYISKINPEGTVAIG